MLQEIKVKSRMQRYSDYELRRTMLGFVVFNLEIPNYIRQRAIMCRHSRQYGKLTCRITHNTKAVRKFYKMNRIALRQAIALNKVQGVYKAGW